MLLATVVEIFRVLLCVVVVILSTTNIDARIRPLFFVITLLTYDLIPSGQMRIFQATIVSKHVVQCAFAGANKAVVMIIVAEIPSFDLLARLLDTWQDNVTTLHYW